MFLDQGAGEMVIEDNFIFNVARSPLRFHKGWTNLVRRNLLVVGQHIPPVRYNDTLVERIKLQGNTVVGAVDSKAVEEALRRAGLEPAYRKKLLRVER